MGKMEGEVIFKALKELKNHLLNGWCSKLSLPEMETSSGTIYKRIIEYLFADTGIDVKMYKSTKDGNKQAQLSKTRKITNIPNIGNEGKKRKKTDGLIVEMKDKTYADLLKTVKQTINPGEIGVDIVDITKTRKGHLLLKVGNGPAKTEELREKLKQKLPEVTTSVLQNDKTIHIKGMDETVTEEEIRATISGAIAVKEDNFKISSLRPAYGGKKNVTVVMPAKDAEKFLESLSIIICWSQCKIQERKLEPGATNAGVWDTPSQCVKDLTGKHYA